MYYLKAFTVWCLLAICAFGRSSLSKVCTPFPAKGLEKLCGYSETVMYDYLSHFDSAVRAVSTVSRMMGSCSPYANLIICSVYIPRCVANIEGPYLPCRRVCDEFNDKCGDKIQKHGMEWIIAMCRLLPAKDDPHTSLGYLGRCFEPPNFKTNFTVESTPKTLKCYPFVVPVCQNIGYKYTVLNTGKQKAYIGYANRKLNTRPKDNSTVDCPLDRKRFFCTENFPACINNTIAFYCRQKCENFFHRNCSSPFFYEKDMCMEFPLGNSQIDICKQTHWPRAQNWPAVKKQSSTQSASNVPLSCYECSPLGMGPDGTGSPLISCSAPKQRKCGNLAPNMPYDRCMTIKSTVKNPITGDLLELKTKNCSLSSTCSGNMLCNLMNSTGAFVKCDVQCCEGNLCNGKQPQTTVGPFPTGGQPQTTVGPFQTGPKRASNVPLSCYECSPLGMGPDGKGSPLINCSAPKQRKCGNLAPNIPYDRCMMVKSTVKNPITGALLEQEAKNCSLSSMCSGNMLCNLMNITGAFVKCDVQCCEGNLCNGGPFPTVPKPENPKAKARQGKSQAANIAGGVFAVFIIALAVLIAYIIYRKKKQTTIPYDKQILYNDDTVDF